MKIKHILTMSMVVILALVGCKKEETPVPVAQAGQNPYVGPNPGAGREDAMSAMNQLVLGTLKLEDTANAVTPEQAKTLLPLWQLIQGGTLQGTDETNAVLKQIESKMTDAQLAATEAMQLTNDDLRAWMEEQGIAFPQGGAPDDQGQGGPGGFQNLSEDERAQMREEFQSLSPEARATRMAELGFQQPGGGQEGQGFDPNAMATRRAQGGGGRYGGDNFLMQPLIALLTERAAQ
jgi:Spy/CpxP family protein refolding chaperone